MEVKAWKGEENRKVRLQRPCECGCDERDGPKGVGYLCGSNDKGEGFTLWFDTEEQYETVRIAIGGERP